MKHEKIVSRNGDMYIPIPESYADCLELIRSDYYRYKGKRASFLKIFAYTLISPPFALTFWLRLAQIHGWLYWPAKVFHRHYSQKFGFQVYPSMKIGYGFCLTHAICVVINPATIIGNNVSIAQFVNIGSTEDAWAVIGDNVYIAPMSCVVNGVHIGSNVTIGAGSVVVKDVPMDATIAGVPTRVLNYNNPGRFVGCRWSLPDEYYG